MQTSVSFILIFLLIISITCLRLGYRNSGNGMALRQVNPLLFQETFEGDKPFGAAHAIEAGRWEYSMKYVTKPVFRGNKAVRFEIRKDQPLVKNGKRSEVTIIKGLPGENMWYSFAVYFPSDGFEKDSERDVISQWYQDGSPATSLRARNDKLFLETGADKNTRRQIEMGDIEKDTWHELVFHFNHSHGEDGQVEVWLNGKKVIARKGGNMYAGDFPKWKIGIYKASFKHGTSDVMRRVLYFDNIKVGTGNVSYTDMIPGEQKPGAD